MAKITESGSADYLPITLEVRPWLKAAYDPNISFSLPDNGFTMAHTLYWIDVTCSLDGEVLFYTRNLIQPFQDDWQAADREGLFTGESEGWGLGDTYPDSFMALRHKTREEHVWYVLEIDLNIARVFGASGDAWRVKFKLDDLDAADFDYEAARQFWPFDEEDKLIDEADWSI